MRVQVASGDTLFSLLRQRGVPENMLGRAAKEVARANHLPDADSIQAGQTLDLPDAFSFGGQVVRLSDQPSSGEIFAAGTRPRSETGASLTDIRGGQATEPAAVRQKFEHLMQNLDTAEDPGHQANAIKAARRFAESPEFSQLTEDHRFELGLRVVRAVEDLNIQSNVTEYEDRYFNVRDALWGHSFWGPASGSGGPSSRYDFEPGGQVKGWRADADGAVQDLSGRYYIDDARVVIQWNQGGMTAFGLDQSGQGPSLIDTAGGRLAAKADWGAGAAAEPATALLDTPFWTRAEGAYGSALKLIFDPGGELRGWGLIYDEASGDISAKPLTGTWKAAPGSRTVKLDMVLNGEARRTAVEIAPDGQSIKIADEAFYNGASLSHTTDFWDA